MFLRGNPWRLDLRSERGMSHFLSHEVRKIHSAASSRSASDSMFSSAAPVRNLCQTLLVVSIAFLSSSFPQRRAPTSRPYISRTGPNNNETLPTPTNASQNTFGRLFSSPVDYVVMAQPL